MKTLLVPNLRNISRGSVSNFILLGSEHGWVLVDREYLNGCVLVSVGLGEDASFDVEFCNRYKSTVIIVDPSPHSVDYFEKIKSNFGCTSSESYVPGGRQSINSYDLSKISKDNLMFVPKALWIRSGVAKFFLPKDSPTGSYSITNIFKSSASIEVPTISFEDLIIGNNLSANQIKILKLDIEGAATEVLSNILDQGFRPNQILVEFEEVFVFSLKNVRKLRKVSNLLESANYVLRYSDMISNFTYEHVE
jgi:FkbM family methyltransferase